MFKLFRKGGVGDQYKMIQQNQEQAQSTLAFGATCWPVSALSYLELALCFSLQANAKLDQYSERCKNGRVPRQLEHTVAPILHPLSARAYGNLLVNYSSHFLGCHWSKKPRSWRSIRCLFTEIGRRFCFLHFSWPSPPHPIITRTDDSILDLFQRGTRWGPGTCALDSRCPV